MRKGFLALIVAESVGTRIGGTDRTSGIGAAELFFRMAGTSASFDVRWVCIELVQLRTSLARRSYDSPLCPLDQPGWRADPQHAPGHGPSPKAT